MRLGIGHSTLGEIAIEMCGFYLPPHARYDDLLNLPEQEDVAKKIKEAMLAIEKHKTELDGVLHRDKYVPLTRTDKTRTSLLPHLISGKLSVEDLNIQFSPNFIRLVFPYAEGFEAITMQATEQVTPEVTPEVTRTQKILAHCQRAKSARELLDYLQLKDMEHFRTAILKPMVEQGLLQLTEPDKLNSPKQRYYTAVQKQGESNG